MRCTSPRTVGLKADGKTLSWSPKEYSKEFATFPLPCGKCIACRLEYARQWAIRCVHEAQMHESNSFITLTYSDTNLTSPKLNYEDFQKFMKRLRERFPEQPIGMFVTGEYGEKNKRPHWHAILFNFRFPDQQYYRRNESGDRLYTSSILDSLWGFNDPQKRPNEIGGVSFESAGYVARYAAKKLVHGRDQDHDYQPISKKSSKHAIGKTWLEQFWPDVVNTGQVSHRTNSGEIHTAPVPRYYERWLQKNQPGAWADYVTKRKLKIIEEVTRISEKRAKAYLVQNLVRKPGHGPRVSADQARQKILESKFKNLQKYLKL